MVRIRKAEKKDPEEIRRRLQKGYGTKHPEKIHGYGWFFWSTGDVYVSDVVYERMRNSRDFNEFVMESLKSFEREDYGYISEWEHDCNIEAKWLFGGNLIGQYAGCGKWKTPEKKEIPNCYIKIRTYEGNTYITDFADWDWVIRD